VKDEWLGQAPLPEAAQAARWSLVLLLKSSDMYNNIYAKKFGCKLMFCCYANQKEGKIAVFRFKVMQSY
jgi:hypothetical protein